MRKGLRGNIMAICIIADSASDITPFEAESLGIEVLPLKVSFGEQDYLDGFNIDHHTFYNKLIESDVLPKTSQVAPFAYEELFDEAEKRGDTILCITLSSKLSGCYQSAVIAADGRDHVYLVDSLNACAGQRILVELAVNLRKEGLSIDQIVEQLEEKKKKIRLIALLDTLEYLKKGGRISSTTAAIGGLLQIKPVIAIENGEVALLGKARGSKTAGNVLTRFIQEQGEIDFDLPVSTIYSGTSDHMLRKYIEDSRALFDPPLSPDELPVSTVGAVIGTHVGPGAIGAGFFVK